MKPPYDSLWGKKKQSGEGSVHEVGEQQAAASLAAQAPCKGLGLSLMQGFEQRAAES